MKRFLYCLLTISFICSCKGFIYHPDEVRPNEINLNARNIERIKAIPVSHSFKFIMIGDTQQFYDEMDDFIDHVNAQNDISFVLLNGDMVDFGMNREYNWVASRLNRLKVPYVATIGNHDMLGNGRIVFNRMFGPENFSFSYASSKFICLNTNSRENGYDATVPDMSFLQKELGDSIPANIFILSHVPPFNDDFDDKLEKSWVPLLENDSRVRLSMHGHEHQYRYWHPYGKLPYLVAGAGDQRNYAMVTVSDEQFSVEEKYY
jgi:3',5'-cyclic-AMP phosphodiesterase